jgi:uncharacterized protein YaeQ
MEFLLTRLLAYCLEYEEGIAFSRGGVSEGDAPPLTVQTPDGRLQAWIEVGAPDAERLNKAAKSAGRVVVYTWRDAAWLRRQTAGKRVHRAGEIVVRHVPPAFLDALGRHVDRRTALDLSVTGRQLYLTVGGETLTWEISDEILGETN